MRRLRRGSTMSGLDGWTETLTRSLASRTSRRSVLGGLGGWLLGATALPLLPVVRGQAAEAQGQAKEAVNDPTACAYWRYCAIDGYLCACCGGSQTTCPPGTSMSPITWIGTCLNPADGVRYVVSYNDCCGKSSCGRCYCNRNEDDTPLFQPGRANDYNWCSGDSQANIPYHCSTSRIVGSAE